MRIENVLQLDATVESPACYLMREPLSSDSSHQVRQREWRGEVRPTFFDGVKQLFITVSCNNCREQMGEEVEEGENPSECHATFKVALINQCDSKHTIREQFTTVFSSSNSRGVSGVGLSLDWQTFIDPSAGFVLGDAAFVRINIRVPSGVPDPTGLTQSAAAGAGVRSGDGAGCSAEVAAPFAGLRRHLRGSVRKRKKKKRSKRPRVPSSSDTDDDTNSSGSISPTVRRLKRPKLGSVDSDLPETPVNVLALNARARDDNCTNAAHDSNEVIASGSSSPDPISTSSSIDGVETAGVSTPQSTSGGSDVAESSSPSPVAVCSHSGDNPNNSPYCPTISAIRHKSSQTDNESETIAESDKIVDGLRCAICLNLFEAPIYLCRTGHSICSKCILRLDKCPSCKNRFLTHTRNFSLEGLTQHVFFPCNSIGCDNSYLLTQVLPLFRIQYFCTFKPLKSNKFPTFSRFLLYINDIGSIISVSRINISLLSYCLYFEFLRIVVRV